MSSSYSVIPATATVAIIGVGRLGGVLARALRHAGLTVRGRCAAERKSPTSTSRFFASLMRRSLTPLAPRAATHV